MTEPERIDRFEAAYNRIDRGLAEMIRDESTSHRTFAARVRIATHERKRLARHKDFLLEIGDLRNAMVHNRTGDDLYLAVPSERTVKELERIERRILAPERVFPQFKLAVTILRPDQTLDEAWQLVREQGHSRYPVYDGSTFVGLLTPNGFTRWCAERLDGGVLHVDARQVRVSDVLAADHRRDQIAFLSRHALIDDADQLFAERPSLEAIIITEHGKPSERPLGLICARDVVGTAL